MWNNDWQHNLQTWLECPYVPAEFRDLKNFPLAPTNKDHLTIDKLHTYPQAFIDNLRESFAQSLEFGTAGLRGKMGIGLTRVNTYTIAVAIQGVATWIRSVFTPEQCQKIGVVIGFDARLNSQLFAEVAAAILAAAGIHVNLFREYCQTPLLAYTTKENEYLVGVMVTASHNPAEYNGFKLYGSDGIQIGQTEVDQIATKITTAYKAMDLETAIQEHLIAYVDSEPQESYIKACLETLSDAENPEALTIAYSPMHGTGAKLLLPLLNQAGFTNITPVKEQIEADGNFPTIKAPNPEFPVATVLLKKLAEDLKVDIAIATDPDADRLAMIIPDHNGNYVQLSGNETAGVLVNYWLTYLHNTKQLPQNAAIVKSIVTSNQGLKIAEDFGVHFEESLTGFKDICGKIRDFKKDGKYEYVMGYEESIGYGIGTLVLDKDGVFTAYLMAHAAAHYKQQGLTLYDVFMQLNHKYGFCAETIINRVREGQHGLKLMKYTMNHFRIEAPLAIGTAKLKYFEDYSSSTIAEIKLNGNTRYTNHIGNLSLRTSNVLRFFFDDNSWYAIRPSGTEPKLKIYIYAVNNDQNLASERADLMAKTIEALLDKLEADFNSK